MHNHSCGVDVADGVAGAVGIGGDGGVFLAKLVHRDEVRNDGVVMAGVEVVHIEAVGAVELFAAVLVGLNAGRRRHGHAVRIVAVQLHPAVRLVDYGADVALPVLDVIIVVIPARAVGNGIAVVCQYPLYLAVLVDDVPAVVADEIRTP